MIWQRSTLVLSCVNAQLTVPLGTGAIATWMRSSGFLVAPVEGSNACFTHYYCCETSIPTKHVQETWVQDHIPDCTKVKPTGGLQWVGNQYMV